MMSLTSPLRGGVLGRRYNRTLHGRSVHRKIDVPGHNVVVGYSRPGTGDALDIFARAGEPVFAMHDGKIDRLADRDGRLSCIYVTGNATTTVYAHLHIKETVKLGMQVHKGELIGWVGRKLWDPHLHLEVWLDEKVVSAKTPELLAAQIEELVK